MALTLGTPFGQHMVLQRGQKNRLWGWDRAGQRVRLTLTGNGVEFESKSVARAGDGAFEFELPALAAGGSYSIRIEGSATQTLDDVVAGEVWLASGQSNMEWQVGMSAGADAEIPRAHFPQIRCLRVARRPAREPAPTVEGEWQRVSPDSVAGITAVGYYFARELTRTLGVPIGIIDASYGGTRVEAWTSREALAPIFALDAELQRYYVDAAAFAELERDFAARLLAWEAERLPADPGNRGEALGFAELEFDDAAWRALRVPGLWQAQGLRFNGVVWYRRALELPSAWAGHDVYLNLGMIDDFDHSYFNGEPVGAHPKGTPGAYRIERRYRVPGRLVRAGRNVLAVRVFDHFGEGGFLSPSPALYAESAAFPGERVSLAGEYRAFVEHEIPLVPGSVFATYPRPAIALDLQNAPASLYNGMIAPLVPCGLAGVIFYQGESNVDEHANYRERFTALIRDWRARFGVASLAFFYVQLAAFAQSEAWPRLREAQSEALGEPNTGMVCTLDIGDPNDIHPRNKLEVGRRLAALALSQSYGRTGLAWRGPRVARVEFSERACRLHFEHAEGLTTSDGRAPRGFELATSDSEFRPATARIDASSVVLELGAPASEVRYAFVDCPDVNLVNAAGLPAEPFRSDRRA